MITGILFILSFADEQDKHLSLVWSVKPSYALRINTEKRIFNTIYFSFPIALSKWCCWRRRLRPWLWLGRVWERLITALPLWNQSCAFLLLPGKRWIYYAAPAPSSQWQCDSSEEIKESCSPQFLSLQSFSILICPVLMAKRERNTHTWKHGEDSSKGI